jgi:hypothetical protein
MFDPTAQEEQDNAVLTTVAFEALAIDGQGKSSCSIHLPNGDADVPIVVSADVIYIQAPLGFVLSTHCTYIRGRISNLEIRVSEEGGPTLPSTCIRRPVYGKGVA